MKTSGFYPAQLHHELGTAAPTISSTQTHTEPLTVSQKPFEGRPVDSGMWFCHNPKGMENHYSGPYLLDTTPACLECGHERCEECTTD